MYGCTDRQDATGKCLGLRLLGSLEPSAPTLPMIPASKAQSPLVQLMAILSHEPRSESRESPCVPHAQPFDILNGRWPSGVPAIRASFYDTDSGQRPRWTGRRDVE
jgi:hypothetical protein